MEIKIDTIIKNLFIMQNCSEFIKQIVDDSIMDFNGILTQIFNGLSDIREEEKLVFLSKLIAEIRVPKKALFDVKNQLKTSSDNNELNSQKKD